MAKKTKPQDQPEPQDQTNPAIAAIVDLLPELSPLDLIHALQVIMVEVRKRHDADPE